MGLRPLKGIKCDLPSLLRTRVDWMFLWGLFAAMRRLSGLKIALKSSLRQPLSRLAPDDFQCLTVSKQRLYVCACTL
eukprot:3732641-Amphidinium_carterae.1